jgi:endonuclease/exonuclease/phosphatase family metal-dependent hydrolase
MKQPRNTIRVATFNVENLFSRLAFADDVPAEDLLIGAYEFDDPAERRLARRIVEAAASDDKRQLTALALHATRADVVCLQEVDNKAALDVFYSRYLKRMIEPEVARERKAIARTAAREGRQVSPDQLFAADKRHYFDWRVVLDGNDGRGIDVAVMSKLPVSVRTHAHRTFAELDVWNEDLRNYRDKASGRDRLSPNNRVFMRDCLEVDLKVNGRPLTLYTTHLKSMHPSRELTRPYRRAEALAIKAIIKERFGERAGDANWIVCGDMNDYLEIDGMPVLDEHGKRVSSSLDVFLQEGFAENVVARRAPDDRWTTYHGPEDSYAQLDFMFFSPALAEANREMVPELIRLGQPYRATRYTGPRFPRVGWDRPKASDHAPVVCELVVP